MWLSVTSRLRFSQARLVRVADFDPVTVTVTAHWHGHRCGGFAATDLRSGPSGRRQRAGLQVTGPGSCISVNIVPWPGPVKMMSH